MRCRKSFLLLRETASLRKFHLKEVQWVSSDLPFGSIIEQTPQRTRLADQPTGVSLKVSREDRALVPAFKGFIWNRL